MYFLVRNCLALTGQNTVQSRFNNVLQTWFNRCLSRRLNRGSALNTGQLRLTFLQLKIQNTNQRNNLKNPSTEL